MALIAEKEVLQVHVEWWHLQTKSRLDTQSRKVPSTPVVVGGMEVALSAWVAGARNRILGQELAGEAQTLRRDLVGDADGRGHSS